MPTCKSPLKGPSFGTLMTLGALRIRKKTYFNKIKFQLFVTPVPHQIIPVRASKDPSSVPAHLQTTKAIAGELPLGLGRLNNPPFCASSSWLHTSGEGQSCLLPFTVQDGTPFSSGKPTLSRIQMSHTHKLVSPTPSLLGGEMCRFKSIDFEICYNQSESSNLSCVFICH